MLHIINYIIVLTTTDLGLICGVWKYCFCIVKVRYVLYASSVILFKYSKYIRTMSASPITSLFDDNGLPFESLQ